MVPVSIKGGIRGTNLVLSLSTSVQISQFLSLNSGWLRVFFPLMTPVPQAQDTIKKRVVKIYGEFFNRICFAHSCFTIGKKESKYPAQHVSNRQRISKGSMIHDEKIKWNY